VEIQGDTAQYRGYYRATGQLRSEMSLVGGTREGRCMLYFADGTPEWAGFYRDGKAEGEFLTYHPNGVRRRVEFHERDTSLIDRQVEFDSSGRRISEWIPEGQPLTGSYVIRKDGRIVDSTRYVRGLREGMSISLGPDGDTVSRTFYNAGKADTTAPGRISKPNQRSTAQILKVLRRKTPDLRHTYNAHLRSARFSGKVTLRFGIQPDGNLAYILPIGDTTRKPRFVRDLLNQIQNWRFDSIPGGSQDIVTVPFTFSE
jgi:hypothetical protein